ncbi:MAG TPA: hypothetical protein VFZ44_18440, partial [Pyrinomonadaceae bacterium]
MKYNAGTRRDNSSHGGSILRARGLYVLILTSALIAAAWAASDRLPAAASAPRASAVVTVTKLADDGTTGTLRQAIDTATAGDTIKFDPNLTGTITLASARGELKIDKELTISGPGRDRITVSGDNAVRVFNVGSVSTAGVLVTISGLTITQGDADSNDPNGSAIRNAAQLFVVDCLVTNNKDFSAGTDFRGGGIYNLGFMVINDST